MGIATLLTCGILFAAPAYAADSNGGSIVDIEEIDEMTGKPIEDVTPTTGENGSTGQGSIYVSDTCTYDVERGLFLYTVEGVGVNMISSNVGSGAITGNAVSVSGGTELGLKIYKDGVEQTDLDTSNITAPGYYVVIVFGANSQRITVLKFTILGEYTNAENVSVSGRYSISNVSLGESNLGVTGDTLTLENEGTYTFTITNKATKLTEQVTTTVLRTPPTLALAALNEKNLARGPVDISDANPEWDIVIYHDNKQMAYQKVLDASGNYTITITDQAGNVTHYAFTILLYLNNMGLILICVVVALAIGAFVYLVISRKKKRVR